MDDNFPGPNRPASSTVPRLIAAFTVVVLVAARGPAMPVPVQTAWANIGLWGLAAFAGLRIAEEQRSGAAREEQERTATQRVEVQQRLDRYLDFSHKRRKLGEPSLRAVEPPSVRARSPSVAEPPAAAAPARPIGLPADPPPPFPGPAI